MKKVYLLLFVCMLGFMAANAQEQTPKTMTGVILFDYRPDTYSYLLDLGELGIYRIKQDGKKLKTRWSYAFIINLMRKNGWTYVDKIEETIGGVNICFIFEKKVNSDDELKEGFELELENEVIIK